MFVTSQFSYFPLVWMHHGKTWHHRAVWMVYQDKKPSSEELLQKDISISVHMKKVQNLATEIFKNKNGLSPIILKEVFSFQEKQN